MGEIVRWRLTRRRIPGSLTIGGLPGAVGLTQDLLNGDPAVIRQATAMSLGVLSDPFVLRRYLGTGKYWSRAVLAAVAVASVSASGLVPAGAAASAISGARGPGAVSHVNPSAAGSGGAIWHRLSLRNGWVAAPRKDGFASPSWAVIRGVVFLRGAVRKARARSLEFAVLPQAARPARTFFIDTINSRVHLVIRADGEMIAHAPDKSQVLAVITAISYPQAGGSVARDLHRLTLLHGWAASDARVAGKPSYALSRAIVYLSGLLRFNPGGQTRSFARLPRAARPRHVMYLTAFTGIFKHMAFIGTITIDPDGRMFAMSPIRSSIWLTGIFFPTAAIRMHALPLQEWSVETEAGPPSYAIVSGVVYLAGAAVPPSSGCVCAIAILPAAAAPRYALVRDTAAGPGFSIVPGGVIGSTSPSPAEVGGFTSLAGTSYPQHS